MRNFFFACLNMLLMAACTNTSASMTDRSNGDALADSVADTVAQKRQKPQANLVFVGDVMMGTNFPGTQYVMKDRGVHLFDDCKDIVTKADIAIANLEGTCYEGTDGELRKMTNPKTYFIFRMPGDHAQNLVNAGFDAVGFANNHSFDFGMTGRRKTIENLHAAGLEVAGVRELAEGCVLERNGVKYGYIAFAASCTKVLDLNDEAEVDSMIAKYKALSDVLIVTFHGGAEGTAFMHVPMKVEYYVGENRGDVCRFAHHCIDRGADIVVGHGPHVPRAVELYKGHFIAYSLGNFCTPLRMGVAGATGWAPLLEVNINTEDGTFIGGRLHSFKQTHGVGPRLDTTNSVAKEMRKLTEQDFPETKLRIEDDGSLCLD